MAISLTDYINLLENIDAPLQEFYAGLNGLIHELLLETYDKGEDPYKKKWAARKKIYFHPILNKTAHQRGSFTIESQGEVFKITNTANYSSYHQHGTKYMAKRKIIPDTTMPEDWVRRIEEYFVHSVWKYLEGK